MSVELVGPILDDRHAIAEISFLRTTEPRMCVAYRHEII